MKKITSKTELEALTKELELQGFSSPFHYVDKLHESKVSNIVQLNNLLLLELPKYDFYDELYKLESYEEIENKVKAYFSQFDAKDKLFQLCKSVSLANMGTWEKRKYKMLGDTLVIANYYSKRNDISRLMDFISNGYIQLPYLWEGDNLMNRDKPTSGTFELGIWEVKKNGNFYIKGAFIDKVREIFIEMWKGQNVTFTK